MPTRERERERETLCHAVEKRMFNNLDGPIGV